MTEEPDIYYTIAEQIMDLWAKRMRETPHGQEAIALRAKSLTGYDVMLDVPAKPPPKE